MAEAWAQMPADVHSAARMSSIQGLRLAISICLSRICFTKTDYPNVRLGLGKAQNMQPAIQVAQRDVTGFAICISGVRKHKRSIEIDFGHSLE
jgi:hypothetical protein